MVFGLSGVVNRALSILLIPLYTRHITPRDYGALGIMMIILSAIPIVLRMGLGNALLRSWYDYEEDERPKLATTVMVFLLATSVPILALLSFLAPYFSTLIFHTDQYSLHLRIICLLAFLEVFNVVPDTLLRLKNSSVQYSISQTVGFVAQLCLIIGFVKFSGWGIKGVLIGNLVGSTLENILMFLFSRGQLYWGFNRAERLCVIPMGLGVAFDDLRIVFLLHGGKSCGNRCRSVN